MWKRLYDIYITLNQPDKLNHFELRAPATLYRKLEQC